MLCSRNKPWDRSSHHKDLDCVLECPLHCRGLLLINPYVLYSSCARGPCLSYRSHMSRPIVAGSLRWESALECRARCLGFLRFPLRLPPDQIRHIIKHLTQPESIPRPVYNDRPEKAVICGRSRFPQEAFTERGDQPVSALSEIVWSLSMRTGPSLLGVASRRTEHVRRGPW